MGVGCVGTACVGDGTREVRALGYAEGAHKRRYKARAASTLRTGVLRVSQTPGRRVQGAMGVHVWGQRVRARNGAGVLVTSAGTWEVLRSAFAAQTWRKCTVCPSECPAAR